MTDQQKQAWSFIEAMTTQLITLAGGAIVLTATFFEAVFPIARATCTEKAILFASWVVLGISVLFGVLVYMRAIGLLGTGNQEKEEEEERNEEKEQENEQNQNDGMVYETLLVRYACLQLFTFLLGIALFVAYMFLNLFN